MLALYLHYKRIWGKIDQTGGSRAPPFTETGKDNFTDRVESDNFGAVGNLHFYNIFGNNSKIKVFGRVANEFRRGGNLNAWDDPYDLYSEHIRTVRYETGMGFEKEFLRGQKINFDYSFVNHYRNATNGAAWNKAIDGVMLDENLNLTKEGKNYIDQYGFSQFRDTWYPKPFIVGEKIHLADFRYSQGIMGKSMLLAGAQFRKSNLDQNINGDESDKFTNDFGLYIQGDFIATKNIELVTGLRYDKHKSEDHLTGGSYFTNSLNPRIALRLSPFEDLTIRATIGTGFRVPYVFSEDLHLCASAPRIFKGADLKPEKSLSLSLGADIYKADYRLGFNIFRTNINDKMEFVGAEEGEVPAGFDYKWTNFGKAYTQGVEAVFAGIAANKLLDYNFNISYIDAKFDKNRFNEEDYPGADWLGYSNTIPRSPNWTGNLSLTFKPNRWKLFVGTNYTGSMFIDHYPEKAAERLIIEKTDSFVIVNTTITFSFNKRMNMFIGTKNIFAYTQKTRDITDAAYIYAPLYGRIFYTGFNLALR